MRHRHAAMFICSHYGGRQGVALFLERQDGLPLEFLQTTAVRTRTAKERSIPALRAGIEVDPSTR
jgi:hypothetical protein